MELDPTKRITTIDALDHDFFWTDPMPVSIGKTLSMHNHSMFEYLAPQRRPDVAAAANHVAGAAPAGVLVKQNQNTNQQQDNGPTMFDRVY